jgi:TolB-like protein/tetratricopeptide (TPR) repeat protein
MSPEQASGETDIDGRSDIYSLGCVLYEMLAGDAPFSGPSVQAIIARRFTERAPSLRATHPTIAPAIDQLIATAMATLPADRFASATELARALDQAAMRAASGENVVALPATTQGAAAASAGRSRRAVWVAAAGGLVAIAATAWAVSRARSAASVSDRADAAVTPAGLPSVAVLHVKNNSADTLDAYLADGLTEEITSALGRVRRVRVKSRAAVARVGTTTADASEAGRLLGVEYVLRGDLTRVGNRVRASVQLVRTADDSEAWSDAFDTVRDSLFAVRDAVVEQIVVHAGGGMSPGDRAALVRVAAVNPAAHDRFLRGSYHLAKRNPVSVAQAIAEFEEAHRIDPAMTSALARAGYAYSVFADWGWPHPRGLTNDELIRRGLVAADSALGQDSTSAEAWLARAHLLFLRSPRSLDGVTVAFDRAVRLDSTNAEAQYQYGQALMASGNAAAAVARYRRAIALEPDWASPLMSLGAVVSRSGDFDGGLRWLDSAIAVDPSSSYSYSARSTTRSAARRPELALRDAQSAVRVASGYRIPPYAAMAVALALGGDSTAARRWADSTVRLLPDTTRLSPTDALYVGAALVRTGQTDRGIDMLERAEPKGAWLWFYMTSPLFDGVRTNARFVRLSDRAKPPGA